jgi:hypothetical protein
MVIECRYDALQHPCPIGGLGELPDDGRNLFPPYHESDMHGTQARVLYVDVNGERDAMFPFFRRIIVDLQDSNG